MSQNGEISKEQRKMIAECLKNREPDKAVKEFEVLKFTSNYKPLCDEAIQILQEGGQDNETEN